MILDKRRRCRLTLLMCCSALAALCGGGLALNGAPASTQPPATASKPGPALDQEGDPLPAGARARLGTVRLRHGHTVMTVAFAPDGKSVVSTGGDHLARRWDLTTGREIGNFGQQTDRDQPYAPTRWMYAIAFAPNGKMLATGDHNDGWQVKTIRIWDAATRTQLRTLQGHTEGILCLAYAPDGKTLASASADGTLRLWDPDKGVELRSLAGHTGRVTWVTWSRDGKRLASAGADGTVRVWDADKGTEQRSIAAHEGGADGVAFSPDGKRIVSGGADKTVRLWDMATGNELQKVVRDKAIRAVAFSPDGKLVACGGGWEVLLWDPDSGKEVRRLKGAANEIRSLAFSPDGKSLAAGPAASCTVFLWETATGRRLADQPSHQGTFVGRVAFSADGRVVTTHGADGTVREWDAATGKQRSLVEVKQAGARTAAAMPGGKEWYAGGWNGDVRVLDAAAKEVRRWKAHDGQVMVVVLSPDGKTLATGGQGGVVVLWAAATGKELRRFDGEAGVCRDLVFSTDGKRLAVVVSGRPVHVFDTAAGAEVRLTAPPGVANVEAESAAFSPDGKLLATGCRFGTVLLWDLASGKAVRVLKGHAGYVMGLTFSPDGHTLAAGNWRNVRLWEVASGLERRRLEGHEGDVTALAFSPDGRSLVSAGSDTTGLVWDLGVRPAELSPRELELTWTDLRGSDAERAYRALWQLAGASKQALPLLREALPRPGAIDAGRVGKLITALDDDDFEKREKATEDLARLGEQVTPALKKVLEGKPSVEVRRRADHLLDRLQSSNNSEERLRQTRALEVVEVMGTPEARTLLEDLAKGTAEAWLTREAKAALERMGKP